jgi:Domain of unknown function (DUF1851)
MLTKQFSDAQYAQALESWSWIGLEDKQPVLSSLFGHTFLQNRDGWWYLDVIAGSLELLWPDAVNLNAVLDSSDGQDEFLLGGLAYAAEARGVVLSANQVYDVEPPPVLGGAFDVANLRPSDFVVTVNIAGQIHDQVRGLAPGTQIGQVTVSDETQ